MGETSNLRTFNSGHKYVVSEKMKLQFDTHPGVGLSHIRQQFQQHRKLYSGFREDRTPDAGLLVLLSLEEEAVGPSEITGSRDHLLLIYN